jgi:hypothetical protein
MNAAGVLCEDFDTVLRNGVALFQWTRLPTGSGCGTGDPLCATGDPNDDVLGYTQDTGTSPTGTDGRICADDVRFGQSTCTKPVAEENDWHLHSPSEGPGTGYDPPNRAGIGAPDGGKAHSGVRSMHWGRHTLPTSTLGDTTRFRQISAFVLDPPVAIGNTSMLDFWHMIQIDDDDSFGNIDPGTSFGGSQVQVSLQALDGKYEKWQRLSPLQNGYNSSIQEAVSICEFDPGDDQIAPANETMCDASPMWSDIGDIIGTDATCLFDTDGNDAAQKDCGEITCTPGPGCTENGSIGSGVWARSTFDLSPFNGRRARVRWIGSNGGGWSFGTSRSFLEPSSGAAYQEFEEDDGWWIDDIKLTNLRTGPTPISPDPNVGTAVCLTDSNPANCGSVSISIAKSGPVVLPGDALARIVSSDTLGMGVTLDARGTVASTPACNNGVLKFEWAQVNGASATALTDAPIDLIQDYAASGAVDVAPLAVSTYRVRALCSSDPNCAAAKLVQVDVYTGDPNIVVNLDDEYGDPNAPGGPAPAAPPTTPGPKGQSLELVYADAFGIPTPITPVPVIRVQFVPPGAAPGFAGGCILPPGLGFDIFRLLKGPILGAAEFTSNGPGVASDPDPFWKGGCWEPNANVCAANVLGSGVDPGDVGEMRIGVIEAAVPPAGNAYFYQFGHSGGFGSPPGLGPGGIVDGPHVSMGDSTSVTPARWGKEFCGPVIATPLLP